MINNGHEVNLFWLLPTVISVVLLVLLIVALFFALYQKKILARKLKTKQDESRHNRELLLASIQMQENERQRIASDLHDDVGAILSTTKLYLSHLVGEGDKSAPIAKKIEELVDTAIGNVRGISRNILPLNLERFGLASAIEEICKQINDAHRLKIVFNNNLEERLGLEQEIHLYRIVQELLNNTIKHAEASEVTIDLFFLPELLTLTYQDNGKGLPHYILEGNAVKNTGLGLKNIRGRAELLKAQVDYFSVERQGLKVVILLDLQNK